MVKQSGFPAAISVDDGDGNAQVIGGDISSFEIGTSRGMQEITGVDKSAIERLLLLADGKSSLKGVFNDAANRQHDVLKSVATAAVARTVTIDPSGTSTGAVRLVMELLFTGYEISRADDGSLVWSVEGELADGTVPVWSTVP